MAAAILDRKASLLLSVAEDLLIVGMAAACFYHVHPERYREGEKGVVPSVAHEAFLAYAREGGFGEEHTDGKGGVTAKGRKTGTRYRIWHDGSGKVRISPASRLDAGGKDGKSLR